MMYDLFTLHYVIDIMKLKKIFETQFLTYQRYNPLISSPLQITTVVYQGIVKHKNKKQRKRMHEHKRLQT